MTDPTSAKLAILIDAENVLPSHAELIFSSAEAMGEVVAKEIYGVAAALTTWVEPVLRYAIHPNLTIKASKGKNTSDIALVIGAMELLLKGDVNTIVIASSDSDFSNLSVRLRTAGIHVVGMGTEKSNVLWRTACSSFIVLEHPASAKPAAKVQAPKPQPLPKPQPKPQPQPAQAQPADAEAPAPQAKTASTTHKDRAAMIQQMILKRLASYGGRVQIGTLFTDLNRMPEYRMDRQGSGRKPLNYLTSTFGDILDFEDSGDGKTWVSVKGIAAAETAPETPEETPEETPAAEEVPAPAEEAEAPAAETLAPRSRRSRSSRSRRKAQETPQEEAPTEAAEAEAPEAETPTAEEIPAEETPVEEVPAAEPEEDTPPAEEIPVEETPAGEAPVEEIPVEETPVEEIPVEEAPVEEAPAEETPAEEIPVEAAPADEVPAVEEAIESDPAIAAFIERLTQDGIEPDVAGNIARILASTDNLRTAYNTLRKTYGNDAGRDYYNRAKEILTGQQG